MKNIKIIFLSFLMIGVFSTCNNDLTEELKGSLNPNSLVTSNDAFALIDGVYQALMGTGYAYYGDGSHIRLVDGITDAATARDSNAEKFRWNEDIALGTWRSSYILIGRANTAINIIEGISDDQFDDVAVKLNLIAEAKFLRAYMYSVLTSSFGDVPLLVGDDIDPTPERTPLSEVVAQIKLDLTDAIAVLPTSNAEYGRATSGAAHTLMAKMYMREAAWAKAKIELDEVTLSGAHDLFQGASYRDLWMETNRKDNEFIFSIVSHGEIYNTASNHHIKLFSPWGYDLGWENFGVARGIFEAMDPADDRNSVIVNDLSGAYYDYVRGYGTALNWQNFVILQKYSGNNRDVTAPGNPWGNYANSKLNLSIFRYADNVLMSAEVENRLGNSAGAYTHINLIRTRAGLPDLTPGLSQDELNDAILLERAIELVGEGFRRDDLIRHGKFVSNINAYLTAYGYTDAITVQQDHELFPIPRIELDLNPNMTANPSNKLAVF